MENKLKKLVEKGEEYRMKIEDAEMRFDFQEVGKYTTKLHDCLNDIAILLKENEEKNNK